VPKNVSGKERFTQTSSRFFRFLVHHYAALHYLANAHLHALDHLEDGGSSLTLNCGYGYGFSVREIVDTVSFVSGNAVPTHEAPHRAGDCAAVVADTSQIKEKFEWSLKHDDLD
jgi:UDP-glucose 4-epimerase